MSIHTPKHKHICTRNNVCNIYMYCIYIYVCVRICISSSFNWHSLLNTKLLRWLILSAPHMSTLFSHLTFLFLLVAVRFLPDNFLESVSLVNEYLISGTGNRKEWHRYWVSPLRKHKDVSVCTHVHTHLYFLLVGCMHLPSFGIFGL